jgi:hypothetical protein
LYLRCLNEEAIPECHDLKDTTHLG